MSGALSIGLLLIAVLLLIVNFIDVKKSHH